MDKQKWAETCAHMNKLIATDAPAMLKAHWLVHVMLPRLVVQIGTKEVGAELARAMTKGLCGQSGTCDMCCKQPSDGDDGLCCRCRAEVDQFAAEAGL